MTNIHKLIIAILTILAVAGAWFSQTTNSQSLIDVTNYELGKFERDYWIAIKQPDHKISDLVIISKASGCIKLEHEITSEGKFANPVVVKQVNGDIFKEALLTSMKDWQWQPAKTNEKNRAPIRTSRFFSIGNNPEMRMNCL